MRLDRFTMTHRTYRPIRAALIAPAIVAGALALGPAAAATANAVSPAATATSPGATSGARTPATSPLPASNYRVRNACRTPGSGHASCLAQVLVPETAPARGRMHPLGMTLTTPLAAPTPAEGAYGLRPEDLRDAYFPGEEVNAPEPQTIALIEAYNDIHAETDLKTYGEAFKSKLPALPACSPSLTKECFEKVNQKGATDELPFPQTSTEEKEARELCEKREVGSEPIEEWEEKEAACAELEEAAGWSLETSLDIEMAHATCQNCRIVLVEADSSEYSDLEAAENTAAKPTGSGGVGATEISNSWGGDEPATDSAAFEHPGTVITAAAGDSGYLDWTEAEEAKVLREPYYVGAGYPASSPHVVAVGGTSLTLSKTKWQSETVWNDDNEPEEPNNGAGGSGCSTNFQAPEWQRGLPNWSAVGCEDRRAVADVSADGDPYTGVAVYDSEAYCEYGYVEAKKEYVVRSPWCTIGGTSVGTPLIAAMYALAGGSHGVQYPAKTVYEHLETGLLHTVSGANGECAGNYASGCTGSMNPQSSRFAFDCGEGVLICNAAAGCEGDYYAGPTGVGTPNGIGAFKPEDHPAKDAGACAGQGQPEGKTTPEGGEGGGKSSEGGAATPGDGGSTAPSTSTAPSKSPDAIAPTPLVSDLALTKTATAALRHHRRPKVSQLAFAFTLNVASRVRVTLARRIVVHGHARWQTLPDTLTIAAAAGRDSAHLSGAPRRDGVVGRLAPGRYRLTLTPAGGTARTLTFKVG